MTSQSGNFDAQKPRLLDLFSGAGGCAKGYQRAGFYVVGVDKEPQPNYCGDEFHQADALDVLSRLLRGETWQGYVLADFAAIHASPPCQAHVKGMAAVNRSLGRELNHRDLIPATRAQLRDSGLPYVIENVEGSTLIAPVRLCGSSLRLPIRRHRLFESSVMLLVPPCDHSWQHERKYWMSTRKAGEEKRSTVVQVYGNGGEHHEWPAALGIDWMNDRELREAIPPAYTELIGYQLMQHALTERAAA